MRGRSENEGWVKDRQLAERKSVAQTAQKVAEAASDNAAIAQRIKAKLLRKLEKEIDALPDSIGSETRQTATDNSYTDGKNPKLKSTKEVSKAYRLRDLTAAYKDLTEDMNLNVNSEPVRIVIDV